VADLQAPGERERQVDDDGQPEERGQESRGVTKAARTSRTMRGSGVLRANETGKKDGDGRSES